MGLIEKIKAGIVERKPRVRLNQSIRAKVSNNFKKIMAESI